MTTAPTFTNRKSESRYFNINPFTVGFLTPVTNLSYLNLNFIEFFIIYNIGQNVAVNK